MSQGYNEWDSSIPRPPGMDDDFPVPEPTSGGLSFMWAQANTLARSISEHLEALKDEYTASAEADGGRKAELAEQLIERFETEKVVLEQVRLVCWRNFHLSALATLPPYQHAVLTLRTRLNFWLKAWNEHQIYEQRGSGPADNTDTTTTTTTDDDAEEDKPEADPAHHLQHWLAELDALPAYPETLPLYSSIDPDVPHINSAPRTDLPKPKVKYSGPYKTVDGLKKFNETISKDMLDYRTPARKATDQRARQGSAPGPGVSLISEAFKKERRMSTDG